MFRTINVTRMFISGLLQLNPDAKLKVKNSTGALKTIDLNELANKLDGETKTESLTAARVLTAADTGKTFFLNLAGGFPVTLPEVADGLEFEFIVGTAPTTAYTVGSESGDDVIIAQLHEVAGAAGVYDDNADVITFVASTAVVGDRVSMICDGTKWYAKGSMNADGGITTGTT